MADQEESAHSQTEPAPVGGAASVATGADGMAAALALEQSGHNPELATDLRSYLHDQRNLAGVQQRYLAAQMEHLHVQMEHLHEQRELTLTHMRYQHFSDWLSAAWKVLLVILGTGVVAAAGWLVWDARHDKGLVIEAFQVPEDLVAKGYTGTVVAARVLDHLKALQVDSAKGATRAASSYMLNWGDNLRVEIPETGVSLGELNRFLRERFGHQTRISGEIVHTDQGLTLHVRAGEESGVRIDGAESEFQALAERAAEKIYAQTQPYRYAFALAQRDRVDEAQTVLRTLAVNTSVSATERAWAYSGLSVLLFVRNRDWQGMKKAALNAIQADPGLFEGYVYAGVAESLMGHSEAAYQHYNQARKLLRSRRTRADVEPAVMDNYVFASTCSQGVDGDVEQALLTCHGAEFLPQLGGISAGTVQQQAFFVRAVHDMAGLRSTVEAISATGGDSSNARLMMALDLEDWSTTAQLLAESAKAPAAIGNLGFIPNAAYATARLGDLDSAQQLIDATPTDCYLCVRTRGKIAALKKDWSTAERWFAEAAKQGPSLPFANTEWGEMLLTKGDIDRAIAQFEEAVKRQPHFADPYQYWGEALLLKGDARGAIKQFEQAVKYAPKWGRIQIQWAAALKKLGRDAEAQKKFAAAEALELVPSERALLAAVKI